MRFFSESEIKLHAETINRMAAYLSELKDRATELASTADAQSRGYFTADQDDQVQQLLVSYWQSRSALFDLILEFRQRVVDFQKADANEFLVPFAAALLLIDAARFLRELATDRPIVRQKLNQPNPLFGIPGGTYDTVQKSLVSSRHAWHLYHALRLYEQKADEFRTSLERTSMTFLIDIIEKLKSRLDVSLARFAKVKLRTRGDRWTRKLGRITFVHAIYGIQKLAASLMANVYVRPGHQPGIPEPISTQLQTQLMPGDILLVRKEYALTNYFLPGYWPHVALYVGSPQQQHDFNIAPHVTDSLDANTARPFDDFEEIRVLESMKDGVFFRPLSSPFASDSCVVVRPKIPANLISHAIERVTKHEGKPYDFDFDFRRSDRLVCTEVVYRAYDGLGPMRLELTKRAGRPTLSGHDLVQMSLQRQQFEPVAAYVPALKQEVEVDSNGLTKLIQAAIQ